VWLYEIKHDGFRIIARKDGAEVKLYSRPGKAFTRRFPGSSRRSPVSLDNALATDHAPRMR
jgi:ATP-dependent DNA ligase